MNRPPTIFFDLGAYNGDTIREATRVHGEFDEIHAFEPLSGAFEALREAFGARPGTHLFKAAAGTAAGRATLFIGQNYGDIASSVIKENRNCSEGASEDIEMMDFPAYFRRVTDGRDAEIALKINIEGGEYEILRAMLEDGSLARVRHLHVDWHWSLIGMPEVEHLALVGRIRALGFPLAGNKLDEIHNAEPGGAGRGRFRRACAYHKRRLREWAARNLPWLRRLLRGRPTGTRNS